MLNEKKDQYADIAQESLEGVWSTGKGKTLKVIKVLGGQSANDNRMCGALMKVKGRRWKKVGDEDVDGRKFFLGGLYKVVETFTGQHVGVECVKVVWTNHAKSRNSHIRAEIELKYLSEIPLRALVAIKSEAVR